MGGWEVGEKSHLLTFTTSHLLSFHLSAAGALTSILCLLSSDPERDRFYVFHFNLNGTIRKRSIARLVFFNG